MARLIVALPLALLSVPAWSQTAPIIDNPNSTPSNSPEYGFTMPTVPKPESSERRPFAATEIGPNATFGLGMFGLKQERFGIAPTTVREVNSPRTRRPALGLSFKF